MAEKTTKKRTAAKKTTALKPVRKATAKRKTTVKKKVTRTAVKRKVTTKGASTVKKKVVKTTTKVKRLPTARAAYTKSQTSKYLADQAGITNKQATLALNALGEVCDAHLRKGSCGKFTLPGLCVINVKVRPARKARKGVNPFTGEEMMFKAKPATRVVKIRPLKGLKDMAQ